MVSLPRHRWLPVPLPWSHTRPTHSPEFGTRQRARNNCDALVAHLDIASAAIQVEMQVFYFTKFSELVRNILLRCLFMNVGDQDDPTFYSCALQNGDQREGDELYGVVGRTTGSPGVRVLDMRRFDPIVSSFCVHCAIVST